VAESPLLLANPLGEGEEGLHLARGGPVLAASSRSGAGYAKTNAAMKKLVLVVLLLVAAVAAALFFLRGRDFVVYVTEDQIQVQLAEVFPLERQYLVVLTVRLSDPEVDLVEGSDRMHFSTAVTASVQPLGRQGRGTGRISGGIRYDPNTHEIFLQDSRIEDLSVEGVPEQYRDRVREVAQLAVSDRLDRFPLYTLSPEILERLPGPIALRDVRVEDGRLRLAFGLGSARR